MSANNQVLVKKHKGKWYVFNNVCAESWVGGNILKVNEAVGKFDTRSEAYDYGLAIDNFGKADFDGFPNSEYGVCVDKLAKDNSDVKIVD